MIASTLRADTDFITRVLADLVRIDSVNPALVPGGAGEARIAAYTADVLASLGAEISTHEPAPGRISVVGRFAGQGGGRSLMLNAHTDTVGVEGMNDPFGARIHGGRLYGRGAFDMKGSLAACLGAARLLRDAGIALRGDLLIAAVADEEHASIGTADVIQRYAVDGAVVTEPTSLDVCVAHKGFVWLEVETTGIAAHGSRPDLGVDANLHMGRVLARLEQHLGEPGARRTHPLLGPASLHAATLQGGTGLSTYAARCTLRIERRTIPGESAQHARDEIQRILDALEAEDAAFNARLEVTLSQPPFEAMPGSALVPIVSRCAERALSRLPRYVGGSAWMDSALLAAAGIDTVIFGPHGEGAHAAEEWVELASVYRAAEILAGVAVEYCGAAQAAQG